MRNLQNDFQGFSSISGSVNDDTVLHIFGNELIKVLVKILDHLRADGMGAPSAVTPVRDRGKGCGAAVEPPLGIIV